MELPRTAPPPHRPAYALPPRVRTPERIWLHVLLFVLTFACVTLSGMIWTARETAYARDAWTTIDWLGLSIGPTALLDGLRFSVPFLLFLGVHEMGHYVAARIHGIDTSPPYFIPLPLVGIGTLGAVIRIREPIPTTRKLFDVGAAGPLAGFIVALGILLYALATLPPPTYLLDMPGHDAINAYIAQNGAFPPMSSLEGTPLAIGPTLLVSLLTPLFDHVPPAYELYHYPTLFAAWLGLFFTALNLLPAGQLDGGHVTYSLFGAAPSGRVGPADGRRSRRARHAGTGARTAGDAARVARAGGRPALADSGRTALLVLAPRLSATTRCSNWCSAAEY